MADLVQIRNLALYRASKTLLNPLCLDLPKRQWIHVLGSNGAGKSTLLKLIAGLQQASQGSILLDGQELQSLSPRQRALRLAYLPQNLEASPSLSALELVAQGQYPHAQKLPFLKRCLGQSHDENRKAYQELARLGIENLAHRNFNTLSGGERQLVLLASIFQQNTELIILDEPFSALDIKQQNLCSQRLVELCQQGKSIISSSHDLRHSARYADYSILLAKAQLIQAQAGFPSTKALCQAFDVKPQILSPLLNTSTQTKTIPKTLSLKKLKKAKQSLANKPNDDALLKRKRPKLKKHQLRLKSQPICAKDRTSPVNPPSRAIWPLVLLCLFLLCSLPFIGSTGLSPFWDHDNAAFIFWKLRLPRVLWGLVCGSTLAAVGASLQALLQNPLATPYTLGLASGASLGAMLAIQLGLSALLFVPLFAFLMALLVLVLVLSLAKSLGLHQNTSVILAGVMSAMFCSALGLLVQAFANPWNAQQILRWQLGALDIVGYTSLILALPISACLGLLWLKAQAFNLLAVDSQLAMSRGLSIQKIRTLGLSLASLAAALVVSICGPIAFIGLLVPHWMRSFYGSDLRRLLPLSCLAGASVILLADTLSRILERWAYLPVGVMTALFGAPLFILTLIRKQKAASL